MDRIPRGSLSAGCLGVQRDLSDAAPLHNDALQRRSECNAEHSSVCDYIIELCAVAEPKQSDCETKSLGTRGFDLEPYSWRFLDLAAASGVRKNRMSDQRRWRSTSLRKSEIRALIDR